MKSCIEHTGGYVVQVRGRGLEPGAAWAAGLGRRGEAWLRALGGQLRLAAGAVPWWRSASPATRADHLTASPPPAPQTDTFTNPIFKDSLRRLFTPAGEDGYLGLASNATFEVRRCLARPARQQHAGRGPVGSPPRRRAPAGAAVAP